MDYLNLLINLALLFLWCRIWTDDENTFFFNPLVSAPMRVVDKILGVLRMPLPFLPNRVLAALALLGALALKAMVLPNVYKIVGVGYANWYISEILNFIIFTLQIAAINALLCLMSPRRLNRAGQVADLLSRPVAWIRPVALQLLVVLVSIHVFRSIDHILDSLFLIKFELSFTNPDWFLSPFLETSSFVLTTIRFLDTLFIWSQCTLIAILSSWTGLIMPRSPVAAYGREFCSLLLGRFSGLLVVGMMDLTPLIFFYVLGWLHGVLAQFVNQLF